MNEITIHEEKKQAVAAPSVGNFLEVIAKAASDPSVDVAKMHGLLDVQERMMNKQAEIDFNQALFRAQKKMPRIKKNGAIKNRAGEVVARYMKFEDIDTVIREIYEAEGFCIMDSQSEASNGMVTVTSTLIHEGGHSKTVEVTLPKDKENSLKSAVQAAAGVVTTGKRINACNLFRIVAEDDGAEQAAMVGSTPISDDQAAELKNLIQQTNTDTVKFLNTMVSGVKSVDEIALRDYERVKIALEAKLRKVQQ